MTLRFQCSECRTQLRSNRALLPGTRCPRCGHPLAGEPLAAKPVESDVVPKPTPDKHRLPARSLEYAGILAVVVLLIGAVYGTLSTPRLNRPPVVTRVAEESPLTSPIVPSEVEPPVPPMQMEADKSTNVEPSEEPLAPNPAPEPPVRADVDAVVEPPPAPPEPAPVKPLKPMPLENPPEVDKPMPPIPPAPPAPEPPVRPVRSFSETLVQGLSRDNRFKVETAIKQGVAYLRAAPIDAMLERSAPQFTIANEGGLGRSALVGLTLLECGVPLQDPALQKRYAEVRIGVASMTHTYSLAVMILFLDRVGLAEDRPVIQSLAGRLLAGQTAFGGWSYQCPVLGVNEERELLQALQHLERRDPKLQAGGGVGDRPNQVQKPGVGLPLQAEPGRNPATPQVIPGVGPPLGQPNVALPIPLQPQPPQPPQIPIKPALKPNRPGNPLDLLSTRVKSFGIFQPTPGTAMFFRMGQERVDDNSNTQFAVLALWAARKHAVPIDRSIQLVEQRYRRTQNADGSWGYLMGGNTRFHSMTCTGLVGLAVAQGVKGRDPKNPPAKDAEIEKAFACMGRTVRALHLPPSRRLPLDTTDRVDKPGSLLLARTWGDLYYLWSLERVGVLYRRENIGVNNWYAWGAPLIVAKQAPDGSWSDAFGPTIDTCLALLFLKRADLAPDLSHQLSPGDQAAMQRE